MRKHQLAAGVAALAFAAVLPISGAHADTTRPIIPNPSDPTVSIGVGSTTVPVTTTPSDSGFTFDLNSPLTIGTATITNLTGNATNDPFLSFSLGVTDDSVSGSEFAFLFSIPLSPVLTGPQLVHASLGVTATGVPGHPATVTPTFGDFMLSNVGACDAGVDIGGPAFTATDTTVTNNYDSGEVAFSPSVGCNDNLIAEIVFNGSGGGTEYSMSGELDVVPVPEPGSAILLVGATLGLAGVRRRRPRLA